MNVLHNYAARPNVFEYVTYCNRPVTSHSLVNQRVCAVRNTHEVRLLHHFRHLNLIGMSQRIHLRCDALTRPGYPLVDCSLYVDTTSCGSVTTTRSLAMLVAERGTVDTADVVIREDASADLLWSRAQDKSHAIHVHRLNTRDTLPANQSVKTGAWVSQLGTLVVV
jgi:hypothetical protein